jgi:pimeloyl-ACP methyl ester carboxylesterase
MYRSSIGTGFMKLLAETADLAEMVSAFVTKGGWITAPLGGALLLYLMQDRLVFNPVRTAPTLFRSGTTHRARAVSISMSDGIRLQGWWLRPNGPCDGPKPAVIYFGGRSEEVSWVSGQLCSLTGVHALFVNYRGYGRSQGSPTEATLLQDALELYDWIGARPGVDPRRIAVIGRSLGSGVAAYVAAHRPAAAAVLITPYDSIVEIARRKFPYCAARILLRHRFESVRFAKGAKVPALVLLAQDDDVVPREHALRLIAAWCGEKWVETIAGTGHCDIQLHAHTWQAAYSFLFRHFLPA